MYMQIEQTCIIFFGMICIAYSGCILKVKPARSDFAKSIHSEVQPPPLYITSVFVLCTLFSSHLAAIEVHQVISKVQNAKII